ncbi:MAG TPA: response regulator [Stellaceae bacterium]|nr:response regulator [Stellaceae bacterium]
MSKLVPKILIVEDDDLIREIVITILRESGFDIRADSNADDALGRIERKNFDLVIADIDLPGGLNGLRMMQKARERQPGLRCLFISGWYLPIVCDPLIDEFISKPFRPGELLGCVWKVLSGNLPYPRVTIAREECAPAEPRNSGSPQRHKGTGSPCR